MERKEFFDPDQLKLLLDRESKINLQSVSSWPEYQAWNNMLYSVASPKHGNYEMYKKQGITVAKEWMHVQNFLADMGRRPKGFILGRIDCTKNFSADNCAWMTRGQNKRNLDEAKEKFARMEYDQKVEAQKVVEETKPKPIFVPEELAIRYMGKLDYLLDLASLYADEEKSIQKKLAATNALICRVNEMIKDTDKNMTVDNKMFDFLENI